MTDCPKCGGLLVPEETDMRCLTCGRRFYSEKPIPMEEVSLSLNHWTPTDLEPDTSGGDCKHPQADRVILTNGRKHCRGCARDKKRAGRQLNQEGKVPPDTGCSYAPSCLNCPFEVCRHDGKGKGMARKTELNAAKVDMDADVESEAERLGVTVRTIIRWRALHIVAFCELK